METGSSKRCDVEDGCCGWCCSLSKVKTGLISGSIGLLFSSSACVVSGLAESKWNIAIFDHVLNLAAHWIFSTTVDC